MLANTMRLMASSASLQPFRNPIRTGSFMNTYMAKQEATSKNGEDVSHESSHVEASSVLNDAKNKLVSNGGRKCASVVVTASAPNNTNKQSESETILSDPSNNENTKKLTAADAPRIGITGGTPPPAGGSITRGTTMMTATAATTTPSTALTSKREVTTVLLQPPMKNHVVYSIDSKPKHLVEGSALWIWRCWFLCIPIIQLSGVKMMCIISQNQKMSKLSFSLLWLIILKMDKVFQKSFQLFSILHDILVCSEPMTFSFNGECMVEGIREKS